MTRHCTRRAALTTIGTGIASLVGAGSAAASGGRSSDLAEQLKTVERATEKYVSVRSALRDGFRPAGPYVPGMGWHFTHPGRTEAAAKEGPTLSEPNVLTYADTGTHVTLTAAEYGVPVPNRAGISESSPPDLFDVGEDDPQPHWHTHGKARHLFAIPNGQQNDPESITPSDLLTRGRWTEIPMGESGGHDHDHDHDHDGGDHGHSESELHPAEIEPGDEVTTTWGIPGTEETRVVDLAPPAHPDLLTLHAWVHLENPNGVFTPTNPNYRLVEMLPDDIMSDRTAEPGS